MADKRRTSRPGTGRQVLALLVAGLTVLGPGPAALATEFRGGDAVHLRDGETLDDLFIAAGDVSVR